MKHVMEKIGIFFDPVASYGISCTTFPCLKRYIVYGRTLKVLTTFLIFFVLRTAF